ncbi:MAG TPA: hypothetical protein VHE30_02470 [Polyangiaceae bacterium]|nr:hypothetical protein [Polyangiaceae bacterium]
MQKPVSSALMLVVLAFATSCQHFQRARECRAIARLVNPTLDSIEAERRKAPNDAATYRRIGTFYDRLAYSLVAFKSQNRRVQEAIADYQRLAKEASHDAHLYADALQAKDETKLLAARASASRTMKHESGAVAHMDGVCRGK